jgi:transcriptional regulator with XRE-family HTH domain
MPDLAAIVARNVRAERHRHGWRQRDLAERMGWSVGMVSDTESGQRRIGVEDLPVLCRALEIPLSQLLHGADAADLAAIDLSWAPPPS